MGMILMMMKLRKSVQDNPAKNAQKSNQNGKAPTLKSKGQESFKKKKTPKTPKEPSSIEDIKAKT